uniref:CRAL-TRIO domain-containing protein n=1 Tax=Attheya septentrionalis TaxID=420275 RepID=A0A7S2U720_9STRA
MATTVCLTLATQGDPSQTALRLTRSFKDKDTTTVLVTRSQVQQAADNEDSTAMPLLVQALDGTDGVYLRVRVLSGLLTSETPSLVGPRSIIPGSKNATKLPTLILLQATAPSVFLASMSYAYFVTGAIFPAPETTQLVSQLTLWLTLIVMVAYEHLWFWKTSPSHWIKSKDHDIQVEITIVGWANDMSHRFSGGETKPEEMMHSLMSPEPTEKMIHPLNPPASSDMVAKETNRISSRGFEVVPEEEPRPEAPPVDEFPPLRFINAEKGNIEAGKKRYKETLKWRAEMGMDTIVTDPHPKFAIIKEHYPHYYHLRGRNNEPCYYEIPPRMNLKALKKEDVKTDDLLRHFALTCEFMWTLIEPSEEGKSIYVIDLDGMGMRDFAGEAVDFVKKTSAFTAAHYPERSGSIFVINVPSWFSIIWSTVKPWVDPVTRKKIVILGYGADAITKALEEKIPLTNIPPEYGGQSMPLGESPEEAMFREKMERNNQRVQRTHPHAE